MSGRGHSPRHSETSRHPIRELLPGLAESESLPVPPVLGALPPAGYDLLFFQSSAGLVQLGFADPNDYYGPITPAVLSESVSSSVTFIFSDVVDYNGGPPFNIFDITSGTATPTPAPEPSSLVLLGIGLLGLPLLRRRPARRVLS